MDIPLVTFGKYKGKPVTELIADANYLEWCKKQDFFKNTSVYNIVVNQVIEKTSSKTPEHNKLQNLFLDDIFCEKIYDHNVDWVEKIQELYENELFTKIFGDKKFNEKIIKKFNVKFEAEYNWDVKIFYYIKLTSDTLTTDKYNDYKIMLQLLKDTHTSIHTHTSIQLSYDEWNASKAKKFEFYASNSDSRTIFLELKPLLGDDYPEVLRKMSTQIKLTKNDKTFDKNFDIFYFYILVKDFNSSTTTREQLIKIFLQHNITIIFMEDLEIDRIQQIDNNILRLQQEILKLQEEKDNYKL
jgi:hypothetical protein